MAKKQGQHPMTDRAAAAAQYDHFKTLVSSTLDNAVAVGHGHAVGSGLNRYDGSAQVSHAMPPAMDILDDEFDSPEQRRAMRRRHAELGVRMQRIAVAALEELERKMASGEPLNLTRAQAETLRSAGEKIEREALGGDPDSLKKAN